MKKQTIESKLNILINLQVYKAAQRIFSLLSVVTNIENYLKIKKNKAFNQNSFSLMI